MARIHVVLDDADRERFRRQAEREGKSLGAWIRDAARDRLAAAERATRIETAEDLKSFFVRCDERESRPEPDWSEHRRVIERSVRSGTSGT